PHLVVCPTTEAETETQWNAARAGLGSRLFALPPVAGRDRLMVDTRLVCSLEKPALLADGVEVVACPLSEPERTVFRRWLGRRFGRAAFPAEIDRSVVGPIEKVVARLRQDANFARVLSTVIFYGLRYTPGEGQTTLLILIDAGRREQARV